MRAHAGSSVHGTRQIGQRSSSPADAQCARHDAQTPCPQLNVDSEESGVLDLHSLGVSEALEAVMWMLANSHPPRTLTIVVGKGLHSKAGKSRIAPAVLSLLKSRNLSHSLRDGQIVVNITD